MSGIHGMSTSFGRCPFNDDTGSTLIQTGPMTASSADAAITYAAISSSDIQTKSSFYSRLYDGGQTLEGMPAPHIAGFEDIDDLHGVRLGIFSAWFNDSQPAVRERCYEAVKYLKSKGATIVEISIPHLQVLSLAHGARISAEFASTWDLRYHSMPDSLEANTRVVMSIGHTITASEQLAGEKVRAWAFRYVTDLMKREALTAIVNPTVGVEVPILSNAAKAVGESDNSLSLRILRHVSWANFLGLPGYSVPIGSITPSTLYAEETKDQRVPVGLLLIGDHWTEHKVCTP